MDETERPLLGSHLVKFRVNGTELTIDGVLQEQGLVEQVGEDVEDWIQTGQRDIEVEARLLGVRFCIVRSSVAVNNRVVLVLLGILFASHEYHVLYEVGQSLDILRVVIIAAMIQERK